MASILSYVLSLDDIGEDNVFVTSSTDKFGIIFADIN
jgi:hypothetical protein